MWAEQSLKRQLLEIEVKVQIFALYFKILKYTIAPSRKR